MVALSSKLSQDAHKWLENAGNAVTWRDRRDLRRSLKPSILGEFEQLGDEALNTILERLFEHPFDSFEPRESNHEAGDDQEGFYESQSFISIAVGGNGCLAPEQQIYDPEQDDWFEIGEIKSGFSIYSRNPVTGNIFSVPVHKPWVKGVAPLYQWTLSSGDVLFATDEHIVVASDGSWITLGEAFELQLSLLFRPDIDDCNQDFVATSPTIFEGRKLAVADKQFRQSHPMEFLIDKDDRHIYIDKCEYLRTGEYYDISTPPYANYILSGLTHANSGKTYTAAEKCVKFLSETPPPKADTPFWVVGDTYDQVCGTCWFEKLREIIPSEWIDHNRITWLNRNRQWPYSVPLMPWPDRPGRNWVLEFKSYEQGRSAMQARSIGGAWFTEQFPEEIFHEVIRGCREHGFPGSVFCEFTPIDPEKSVAMRESYEKWLAGDPLFENWSFYFLNTEVALNTGHVDETWYKSFFASISEEMKETRMRGAFAAYEGVIFKSFSPNIHLAEDIEIPPNCIHKRSFDWGASTEHPLVCLFGAKDAIGRWIIYDEYWNNDQSKLIREHAKDIKDMHEWPNEPNYQQAYGDPSRPDMFREFGNLGISVSAANNSVMEGIETVREHLKMHPALNQPMILIDKKRCPNLAREMGTYRWHKSTGKGTNPQAAKPVPLKMKDDCVDALRYLLHTDKHGEIKGMRAYEKSRPQRESIRHKTHAMN